MVAAGFVVVIVAALSWIVLLSGSNRVGGESADPAVMDVLPVDFSPSTLWRVERRRSPSVMKLTIELSNATETILVYPAYPAAGDTPPVEQPFLIIGDTVSDVDRLTPISVQPDSCVDTCTVVLRLGDAHDVHVIEHWGGAKPVERFDSVVVNVVHWGEFALDMEAVRVAVTIER